MRLSGSDLLSLSQRGCAPAAEGTAPARPEDTIAGHIELVTRRLQQIEQSVRATASSREA